MLPAGFSRCLSFCSTSRGVLVKNALSIFLFRKDLRLLDNSALSAAARGSSAIIPLFVWSPDEEGAWTPGGASRFWLHQSLAELDSELRKHGSRLVIRDGASSLEQVVALCGQTGAKAVYFNRRYDPPGRALDRELEKGLSSRGIQVETFNSTLLHEPDKLVTRAGTPFKVYTPFWNNLSPTLDSVIPAGKPEHLSFPDLQIESLSLDKLKLEPQIDWAGGIRSTWAPGERSALKTLDRFLDNAVLDYGVERDRPDHDGTSMISPHLAFGEIGPRQIWSALRGLSVDSSSRKSLETYAKELLWREFAYHIIYNFPHTSDKPLREDFLKFPWSDDWELLKRWQRGETGYPIVDAGMRQLWHTGWMHNRVRMIVASFLTKDLLISWIEGARWFWDTLVDADLASNSLGWQWASGCGADAAPYFRIFNPELQGQKFDPNGDYVRLWVPELAQVPSGHIHAPWKAPELVLRASKIELGRDYPHPVVDHGLARKKALEALSRCKVGATAAGASL